MNGGVRSGRDVRGTPNRNISSTHPSILPGSAVSCYKRASSAAP